MMQVFWIHGFAATSLDMLAEASGLNRPSIYATFGSKSEIYRKCLQLFEAELSVGPAAALEADGPLGSVLRAWFGAMIAVYTGAAEATGGRGCFIMTTAPAEAQSTAEVAAALDGAMSRQHAAIEERLQQAQQAGQLAPGRDTGALALLLAGVLQWLSLGARVGRSGEDLMAAAEVALAELGL